MFGRVHDIDKSFDLEESPTRLEIRELKEKIEALQEKISDLSKELEETRHSEVIELVSQYRSDIISYLGQAKPSVTVDGYATITLWESDLTEIRNLLEKLLEKAWS
jgi:predicted RNase H-like nuclease (RuvC/YqgF family)